jgi:hypothetical protein
VVLAWPRRNLLLLGIYVIVALGINALHLVVPGVVVVVVLPVLLSESRLIISLPGKAGGEVSGT